MVACTQRNIDTYYILKNLQQFLNGLFCVNEQQRSYFIIYLISETI